MNRNLGLDLLRIVSMLGIIGLHILNRGGVLFATKWFTASGYMI